MITCIITMTMYDSITTMCIITIICIDNDHLPLSFAKAALTLSALAHDGNKRTESVSQTDLSRNGYGIFRYLSAIFLPR